MARVYDEEILPLWSQRFGAMLLRGLTLPPRAVVLDVACGTGYPSLEILKSLDEKSRIIAIEPVGALLDVARKKAGDLSGKRIFFRTELPHAKLAFADDVYDLVVSNAGLNLIDNPALAIREFSRVVKPGGQIIVTVPLAGTWREFYDIYREVLIKHDQNDTLERLEKHIAIIPEPEEVASWFEDAGLEKVEVEAMEYSLLFKSSREFFFAPVIEFGPLPDWKEIAGKGQVMQETFWHIKETIDAYFGDRVFAVTIKAGCFRARKSETVSAAANTDGTHPVTTGRMDLDQTPPKNLEPPERPFKDDFCLEEDEDDEDAQV